MQVDRGPRAASHTAQLSGRGRRLVRPGVTDMGDLPGSLGLRTPGLAPRTGLTLHVALDGWKSLLPQPEITAATVTRPRTVAFCGASAGSSHSGDCAPQRDRKRCNRGKPHGSGRCLHNTPFLLPPERRSPPPCWEQGGGPGRVPGTGAAAEPGCAWGIGSAWGSSGAGSGGRPAAGMPTASFPVQIWLRLRGKGGDEGTSVTGVGSQPEPPPFATERPVSPPSSRRLRQGSLAARPDTKQRGLHVVRRHPKPWAAKNSFERSQTENFNLFKATFESLSAAYEHVDQTQSPGLDCGGEPRSQIVMPTLKKRSRPRNSSLSKARAAARQAPARLTARGLGAFPQGAEAEALPWLPARPGLSIAMAGGLWGQQPEAPSAGNSRPPSLRGNRDSGHGWGPHPLAVAPQLHSAPCDHRGWVPCRACPPSLGRGDRSASQAARAAAAHTCPGLPVTVPEPRPLPSVIHSANVSSSLLASASRATLVWHALHRTDILQGPAGRRVGEGSAHESHLASLGGEEVLQAPGSSLHPPTPRCPWGSGVLQLPCPLLLLCPWPCRGRNGDPSVLFLRQGPTLLPLLLCKRGRLMPGVPGDSRGAGTFPGARRGCRAAGTPPPPVPHSGDRGGPTERVISGRPVAPGMKAEASRSSGRPTSPAHTSAGCCAPPARPAATGPGAPAVPPRRRDACSCSADRRPRGLRPGPAGKWLAWPSQSPGQLAW